MKYIKMLGLLAVAAAALMAFAGSAAATTITSSTGATPTIKASSTHTVLHGSFTAVTCANSTVEGTVEKHGAAVTAEGAIKSLTFSNCNYTVHVKKPGTLIAHSTTTTGNGTLTSSGAEIEVTTSVGVCVFKTSGTDIGTVTGSSTTKGQAVLDINSAKIPQESSNFFCGSSGTWTGTYKVSHPSELNVH